ncbi:ISL3 family transposase [Virgibacillus soli]|uniref:ISL3 family transposase n=1 Tax=Paracerasibacillus soli TaxID=480284 RepID=A0ABU5CVC2_9BACI|nr:ISL3 family transposase [Virgibacillus soli]MDY0410328.1 ISL3 family transposase [Virgibacillus soli]
MKILLDIQDKNITIEEDSIQIKKHQGILAKFISAKLTYTPTHCECCGVKNENYTVYKNGTKTSRITLPMSGIYPTFLNLKKQRFFCKACNASFIARTSIVKEHCFISYHTRAKVLIKSTDAQSLTDIAKDCSVSTTTVQRIITTEAKKYEPYYHALPKHLSFDEFKYAKGQMAFEYVNGENGDILDILDRRDSHTIKNHFIANYQRRDLKKVETVTIDMNAGYVNVIQEVFPQAKIIIDRFHLVQLISRAMNMTRVRVMNSLRTSSGEDMKKYRRLKRYWRLLLKYKGDLSYTEYKYYRLFGQRLEVNVVEELLSYDANLKVNYNLYQSLLESIKEKDFKAFENILSTVNLNTVSRYMRTSVKTLKKHLPFIENSLSYPYSNGRIEGINNKIKVLNRVAYGYRNFNNFKSRIMLHFKLKAIISQQKESVYPAA